MNLTKIAKIAGVAGFAILAGFGIAQISSAHEGILPIPAPAPAMDESNTASVETAVFAGGCFWGVQGVFQHVKGVQSAISGYSGGNVANPTYEMVGSEQTGHAESVKVTFDPKVVSYGKLLQIFFSVIADPTTLNLQGNDQGTSYRSALFTMNDDQAKVAKAYIAQLDAAKIYPAKIVTEITPYSNFYQAEDYHQDNAYTEKVNPGYLNYFDEPKIADFKAKYADYWMDKPVLVFAANA